VLALSATTYYDVALHEAAAAPASCCLLRPSHPLFFLFPYVGELESSSSKAQQLRTALCLIAPILPPCTFPPFPNPCQCSWVSLSIHSHTNRDAGQPRTTQLASIVLVHASHSGKTRPPARRGVVQRRPPGLRFLESRRAPGGFCGAQGRGPS